jgi:8-oxo-dGTP diphosphatase
MAPTLSSYQRRTTTGTCCPGPCVGGARHSVAIVAGIDDRGRGRALLIQRPENGRWEPPGGALELEETFHDGCAAKSRKRPGSTSKPESSPGSTRTWPVASSPSPSTGVHPSEVPELTTEVFACRILDAFQHRIGRADARHARRDRRPRV